MAELSGLGAIVRTALSSLTGAARLAHTAINGLGTAAIANVGAAEGNVPALGEGGKLDPGVLPDDLGTGTGDVTGPASPVANGAAVVWDGITGRALRSAGGPPLLQSALTTALAAVEPRATLIDWTTASRELAPTDDRAVIRATHATPVLTIAAGVEYPVGMIVSGTSVHRMTIVPGSGLTINGATANVSITAEGEGGSYALMHRAPGIWVAAGGNSDVTGWLDLVADPAVDAADGDLMVFGPPAAAGRRTVAPVAAAAVALVPYTFFHGSGANGRAEPKTYAETWALLESARPYGGGAQVATLISNVVNFSVAPGAARQIKAPALTANSLLSTAVWDGILAGMERWTIRIQTGATGRTFGGATPTDGIEHVGYDKSVALTALSYVYFELYRFDNKPVIEKRGEALIAAGASPDPVFIAHVPTLGVPVAPTSIKVPAHNAGDLEIYVLATNSSALPSIPGSLTAITADADVSGPSTRLAYRVSPTTEAGETTLAGFSGVTSGHCVIVRQATGTPQIHGTVVFANTAAAVTTLPCGSLDAGANAIYFVMLSGQSTDVLTLPAGVTPLAEAYNSTTPNNRCMLGYTSVLPSPGWVSANGGKSGVIGRANALVFAVKAG